MTSFLVNAVLAVALIVTTWKIQQMRAYVRRLRAHQAELEASFEKTSEALGGTSRILEQLYSEGGRLLIDLANRIDEARQLTREMEAFSRKADSDQATAPNA